MLRQTSRIVTIVLLFSAGLCVIASLGLVAGCPGAPGGGSGGDPVEGVAGRPCFANGTCSEGLSCEENTCVDANSEESNNGSNEGNTNGSETELDWFTSSCAELGGVETALGACSILCSTDSDCPVSGLYCTTTSVIPTCYPSLGCTVDSDCGPSGWYCKPWGCHLECTEPTSGAQSSECPPGFSCQESPFTGDPPFCTPNVGAPIPCPSRCQSSSGLCCRPPSCAGDCIGSPCCR